jgi:hypothetical protein
MNGDIRDLLVETRKSDNPPPDPKTWSRAAGKVAVE